MWGAGALSGLQAPQIQAQQKVIDAIKMKMKIPRRLALPFTLKIETVGTWRWSQLPTVTQLAGVWARPGCTQ